MSDPKTTKSVATVPVSSRNLVIWERIRFQRTYDLAERVISDEVRGKLLSTCDGLEVIYIRGLCATTTRETANQFSVTLTKFSPDVSFVRCGYASQKRGMSCASVGHHTSITAIA